MSSSAPLDRTRGVRMRAFGGRKEGACISPVYLSSQGCRKVDFIDRTGHQGRRRTANFGGLKRA